MDDLISRQAAIDDLHGKDPSQIWDTADIEVWINGLPSVEPERKIELQGDESAIEILSELRSWFSCFDRKEGLAYHALSLVIRTIKADSVAEPERKKGKWVFVHPLQIDDPGAYMCSECKMGMWEIIPSVYHYCPNCGIEMEGKDLMEKLEEL